MQESIQLLETAKSILGLTAMVTLASWVIRKINPDIISEKGSLEEERVRRRILLRTPVDKGGSMYPRDKQPEIKDPSYIYELYLGPEWEKRLNEFREATKNKID